MSTDITLTEAERGALACRCCEPICPLHNEAADGYIEHMTANLLATVEAIVSARVQQAKAEALREMANEFRTEASEAWGGDRTWVTNGCRPANLAADWCNERADRIEEDQ